MTETGGGGRVRAWACCVTGAAAMVAGCGGKQSTLNPQSEQSRQITTLWWWMLAVASIVFIGAVAMLVLARLRHRPGLPFVGEREGVSVGLVVGFGFILPVVVLIALFIVANIGVAKTTSAPKRGSTSLTVHVIGHQWFWEVRYPGTTAYTANEIHIPTGTRVNVVASTDDVIHSFWVPELNRKIDMIPGRSNRVLLYAKRVGTYRGQCAELCGLQHAHMAFSVFADPPSRFRGWLANEARPARAPATAAERAGRNTFMADQCASCHTLRGTPARGAVGPDLTHFGGRTSIAANTLVNNPRNLAEWIRDPQHLKPGNRMPDLNIGPSDVSALTAYLESLR